MSDGEAPQMVINAVEFKRAKDSPWEDGIMINSDELIVGFDGKPVVKVYQYNLTPHRLTLRHHGRFRP